MEKKITEPFSTLGAEIVIVLGCRLEHLVMSPRRGAPVEKLFYPSTDLRGRLDKAIEVYKKIETSEKFLIASGGDPYHQGITQAEVMVDYVVGGGVPRDRAIPEPLSVSTIENVLYSGGLLHTIIGGQPKKRRNSHDDYQRSKILQSTPVIHKIHVISSDYQILHLKSIFEYFNLTKQFHCIFTGSRPPFWGISGERSFESQIDIDSSLKKYDKGVCSSSNTLKDVRHLVYKKAAAEVSSSKKARVCSYILTTT